MAAKDIIFDEKARNRVAMPASTRSPTPSRSPSARAAATS